MNHPALTSSQTSHPDASISFNYTHAHVYIGVVFIFDFLQYVLTVWLLLFFFSAKQFPQSGQLIKCIHPIRGPNTDMSCMCLLMKPCLPM